MISAIQHGSMYMQLDIKALFVPNAPMTGSMKSKIMVEIIFILNEIVSFLITVEKNRYKINIKVRIKYGKALRHGPVIR
jgi:hypothetical protein